MALDIEERQILERTAALAKENNVILKKLRRAQIWSRVSTIIYWVIVIGLALGAFYFLQPYIEQVQGLYRGVQSGVDQFQSIFNGDGSNPAGSL